MRRIQKLLPEISHENFSQKNTSTNRMLAYVMLYNENSFKDISSFDTANNNTRGV